MRIDLEPSTLQLDNLHHSATLRHRDAAEGFPAVADSTSDLPSQNNGVSRAWIAQYDRCVIMSWVYGGC